MIEERFIFRALTGSRSHGLHNEDSDYDYKYVHIAPTYSLLSVTDRPVPKVIPMGKDDISYELGHFLSLALKSNPTILEVCTSKYRDIYNSELHSKLMDVFPYCWSGLGIYNSYRGYMNSQRTRITTGSTPNWRKTAVAWYRAAATGINILTTGSLSFELEEVDLGMLRYWKFNLDPDSIKTEVFNICVDKENEFESVYESSPFKDKQYNLRAVNHFLLDARKQFWL